MAGLLPHPTLAEAKLVLDAYYGAELGEQFRTGRPDPGSASISGRPACDDGYPTVSSQARQASISAERSRSSKKCAVAKTVSLYPWISM